MNKNITLTQAFTERYYDQKYILNHLTDFNSGKEVDWNDLTKLFLTQFVAYLYHSANISRNSARQYCSNIKALLNIYSDEIEIPTKEYAEILSLKKADIINIYLTIGEIQKLINYKPKSENEHIVRNQFVISCLTGMRLSEVILIDESNIQKDEISFYAPKTMKASYIPCNDIVKTLIREKRNKILSKPTFNARLREICKAVGINETVSIVRNGKLVHGEKHKFIASHTARRSFATNVYLETKDIMLVSSLMGHSDIKTTRGYLCCDYRETNKQINYFNQFQVISR